MGNNVGRYSSRFRIYIHNSNGHIFRFSDLDLIEHVLLLRRVIAHPQITENGSTLTKAVEEYCHLMATEKMTSTFQQADIPWSIEWIWHVHRLHPVNYIRDCQQQISGGYIIDKRIGNFYMKNDPLRLPNSTNTKSNKKNRTFKPSFDLVEAVIRQQSFLKKFQNHSLFSSNINYINKLDLENSIQNFVSFMKLSEKNTIVVPTFDIDLIWHTVMRYPLNYIELSTSLCGRVLDHDDSIPTEKLAESYEETARRWKKLYLTDYGQNINEEHVRQFVYPSSCALIYKTKEEKQVDADNKIVGGGCGGFWETKNQSNTENSDSDGSDGGDGCGGNCGGD